LLPGEEKLATSEFNWLRKPALGGGGSGIRFWDERRLNRDFVLQAYVDGLPASAAFVADGKKGIVIGLTRQLIGHHGFGASGYCWCGNILPLPMEDDKSRCVLDGVQKMVSLLTQHFGLKGVGGIDFIISDGPDGRPRPFLVEINPRYTASMELIEWSYGLNIYSLHIDAVNGYLPEFSLTGHPDGPFFGKAIVFARNAVVIPDTGGWSQRGWKDIPYPGDEIKKGRPVCTVFARGNTYNECLTNLLMHDANVRRETGDTQEGI
jgi:predicted ATP-grasp superfamily ATP-dependent carboligase